MANLDSSEDLPDFMNSVPAGKVFQGGNYKILNRMLDIGSSSDILYVKEKEHARTHARTLPFTLRSLPLLCIC